MINLEIISARDAGKLPEDAVGCVAIPDNGPGAIRYTQFVYVLLPKPMTPAERAVIEAADRWDCNATENVYRHPLDTMLRMAVRALRAERAPKRSCWSVRRTTVGETPWEVRSSTGATVDVDSRWRDEQCARDRAFVLNQAERVK